MSIYIMTHRDAILPRSSLYKVVGLGGYISPETDLDSTSGDSISSRNKYYNELTGIYFVWKNTTSDLVGICHYRRFFNFLPYGSEANWVYRKFTNEAIELLSDPRQEKIAQDLLCHYDVIVPKAKYSPELIGKEYVRCHGDTEWKEFINLLDQTYGPYAHAIRKERRNFLFNMMICKREIFDRYCSQLFPIINHVFELHGIKPDVEGERWQPYRYPGYLGERFMTAFINANRIKYYEAEVICFNE